MAQLAVSAVLERVGGIAIDEAIYLWGVSDKLESAKKQLLLMQAFLKDLDDKKLRGGAMAKNLVSEVREVAYQVENIIDTANILKRQSDPKISITGAISKYVLFPIYLTHLHKLGAKLDSVKARMERIFDDFGKINVVAAAIAEEPRGRITEDESIKHLRSVHPDVGEQVDVVGFDDQIKQIEDDLLDGENRGLTVVSIVGPGGAGKSTMAKKVYNLVAAKEHFQVATWIIVSQSFEPRDLLKEIVRCAMGAQQPEGLEKKVDHEVKKLLHDFLLSKRYLIVLDDVWSTIAWDIIRDAFPNTKNGSRVVLTTRNEAVARYPNARKQIYKPKLLDREESTRLLLSRALPEYMLDGSNNSHVAVRQNLDKLKELGEDLALKCNGLPLALVVLGAEKVIGGILDLSYYDMPSHLRSCFLYTAAFPEDFHIDIRVLTSLWIAEGFIPLVRGQTRKEVAVKYVAELVQRCMIQVEKRMKTTNFMKKLHSLARFGFISEDLSERITVIKVHDILRDWGIGRARREGLMKDCHSVEDLEAAYSEEMEAYRVVLHDFTARKVRASIRHIRTILGFTISESDRLFTARLLQGLHYLRVLHLDGQDSIAVHLPKEIGQMRYLRYLGLGGSYRYHLPSSIGDLLSLEELYATAKIDYIPSSLWRIPSLRRVHASLAYGWSVPQVHSHSKVQATVVGVSYLGDYVPVELRMYTCPEGKQILEESKFQVSKSNLSGYFAMFYFIYGSRRTEIVGSCNEVELVGNQLDIAYLSTCEGIRINVLKLCCANVLSNDQKILELGRSIWLEVLEIGEQSYRGPTITCPSGSFPNLTRLVLHDLALVDWKLERGSMEKLRELSLCKCPNLSHLPEGLLWLRDLRKLDLIVMPPGCYQEGTVALELQKKGCRVLVSSNEEDFHHVDILGRIKARPADLGRILAPGKLSGNFRTNRYFDKVRIDFWIETFGYQGSRYQVLHESTSEAITLLLHRMCCPMETVIYR
ncbi:hypothetical protein ACP70R_015831 [Stipagrostis hirtigluma subsp. patula]